MLANLLLLFLILCVLVQVAYAFYYFYPLANYVSPETDLETQGPVSVVICAHNEYQNLQQLLPVVLAQDYPAFEVIIVDDRSTDKTPALIRQWQTNYPYLRLVTIRDTPAGLNPKKYALTLGIRAARYDFFLLTDADCKPLTNKWITYMQQGFATGAGMVIGYSPYLKIYGFLNYLIRYETLLTAIQYLSFTLKGNTYMAVGRNVAYTKKCFYQNKGFASHVKVIGGDDDLFVQEAVTHSTTTIEIRKDAQTISIPKQTYREWIIQKRRHLSVGLQYKLSDRLRIGCFIMPNIFFYLISIVMLLLQQHLWILGILFLVRCIVLFFGYVRIARKLHEKLPFLGILALDAAYFLHYLFLGVSVLMFKKVRWK